MSITHLPERPATRAPQSQSLLRLPIAAPSEERAVAQARLLLERLTATGPDGLGREIEAAWRSARGQTRWVVTGRSQRELVASLEDFIFDGSAAAASHHRAGPHRVTFIFSGMGPQWSAMGRNLSAALPRFEEHVVEFDKALTQFYGSSVWDHLSQFEPGDQLPTGLAQPGNFLLQGALYHLLLDEGIEPEAVIGHSAGEVASAYAAGVYSLEEAARVAVVRGRLQATLEGRGAMLAIGLSHDEAIERIADYGKVSIAAVNDDEAVTVAGDEAEIDKLSLALAADRIFAKKLRVAVPYHSPVMDEISTELESELHFLTPSSPTVDFYSTVSGARSDGAEWGATYWPANVRQPVLFADAITLALEEGSRSFVELAPHPVLSQSILSLASDYSGVTSRHLLSRREPEFEVFGRALAELAVDAIGRPCPGPSAPLIAPALERQELWDEDPDATAARRSDFAVADLSLLGRRIPGPALHFEMELSTNDQPWLLGHEVQGLGPIVPATMWAELVTMAATEGADRPQLISNLQIVASLPAQAAPTLLSTRVEGGIARCLSRPIGEPSAWTLHAVANVAPSGATDGGESQLPPVPAQTEALGSDSLYRTFRLKGLNYQGLFRNLSDVRIGGSEQAWATITSPEVFREGHHAPWVVDAGLQLLIAAARDVGESMYLPFKVERVLFRQQLKAAGHYRAHAQVTVATDNELVGTVQIADEDGTVIAEFHDIICARNHSDDAERANHMERHTYTVRDLTPAQAAERFTPELDDDDPEDGWDSDEPASASDTAAFQVQEGEAERQVWIESDTPPLFARPTVDPAALSAGSGTHALWRIPQGDAGTGRWSSALAAAELIARLYDGDDRSLTLTLIGDTDQHWIAGLRRSAANAYGARIRSVVISPSTSTAALEQAVAMIDEHELRLEGDELKVRRVDHIGATDLRTSDPAEDPSLVFDLVRGQTSRISTTIGGYEPPSDGEVCIAIDAVPFMWKDVGKAFGTIGTAATKTFAGNHLGLGAAGVVTEAGPNTPYAIGDKVFGLVRRPYRQHATVKVAGSMVEPLPPGVAPEVAIGHCMPWLTTIAALEDAADLKPGHTIFIQSGAGAVGSVMCHYAARLGANVVTSVGDAAKVSAITDLVPSAQVIVARGDAIPEALAATGLVGFDRIVATVPGPARTALCSMLKVRGRYIDLGKPANADDSMLTSTLDGNRTLTVVDVDQLIAQEDGWFAAQFKRVVDLIADPENHVPVSTFRVEELPRALGEMARGNTIGPVVVEGLSTFQPRPVSLTPASIRSDGTYLITGGYGAVGILCAQWLAARGAKHLVLAGSSGNPNAYGRDNIAFLQAMGTTVTVETVDMADPVSASALVERIHSMGRPLCGAIHAAGVISDGPFEEIDAERVQRSFGPKLEGAHHLADALVADGGATELDFLLLTSSISGGIGISIQATYAAANTGLDGLAADLRTKGVNACAMQLGPIAEAGMAGDEKVQRYYATVGLEPVAPRRLFSILDLATGANVSNFMTAEIAWHRTGRAEPATASSSLLRHIIAAASTGGEAELDSLLALDHEDRTEVLSIALGALFRDALGGDEEDLDSEASFVAMGADSLAVMEVQVGINEVLQHDVPLARLFNPDGTISQLASRISEYLNEGAAGSEQSDEPANTTDNSDEKEAKR